MEVRRADGINHDILRVLQAQRRSLGCVLLGFVAVPNRRVVNGLVHRHPRVLKCESTGCRGQPGKGKAGNARKLQTEFLQAVVRHHIFDFHGDLGQQGCQRTQPLCANIGAGMQAFGDAQIKAQTEGDRFRKR